MLTNSIGDQARAYAMRSNSGHLRTVLHVLTKEIANGEVADLGQRLRGNAGILHDIEARLTLTEQYQQNVQDAATQTNEEQEALGVAHKVTAKLADTILAQPIPADAKMLDLHAIEAAQALNTVVSRLNLDYGGQYLFSGQAVDRPPLISAKAMLEELQSLTDGLTLAEDIAQAVTDWFDAPPGSGGFLDVAYKGTLDSMRQSRISGSSFIELGASAADPAVRDVLKGVALTALAGSSTDDDQHTERLALARKGGEIVFNNQPALVAAMARIGTRQKALETQGAENAASLSVLQKARNDIRQVDPYETAVALIEAESQMNTLYTLTARLSKLNLTEYLR
ncbi:flagellin [Paracoccus methylarcula]|uniref:Uncharacterized protein n=1 Tax=Paracoccus methylarcula TaxID=72022 RepID=A0A3R7P6I4_9RHOB|nr:flagellin [Paracoccus methylarcula]RNF36177.1 hypothetical protein A7A09_001955 [Paracoccus methylarcula]